MKMSRSSKRSMYNVLLTRICLFRSKNDCTQQNIGLIYIFLNSIHLENYEDSDTF